MAARARRAVEVTRKTLASDLNAHGAHMASSHYIHAGMSHTLTLMQQLKTAGIADLFADVPRVPAFAEFLLQLSTPPEVRFGDRRKLVCVAGDGSTESSELYGQLATGLADVDRSLSQRLMHLWRAQGAKHFNTALKIDEDLPDGPADLATTNIPGYCSVFRSRYGTRHETAVWFLNGNHYWDHSHQDQGEVVIYALGAPLSIDWGSMYSPRVSGLGMHSLALPEQVFERSWDADSPPLEGPDGAWGNWEGTRTVQEEFRASPNGGGWARATMTNPRKTFAWTRAVSVALPADDVPIIAIQDSFSGQGATGAKVFTLNLMAEGAVETPAGRLIPTPRLWGTGIEERASAGRVVELKPGVNRLGFTGQAWPAHPTKGIEWEIYVVADEPQQVLVGNWAHAWHPGPETRQFLDANGRSFEERQHILRLRGTNGFRVLLVPYLKGRRPADLDVKLAGDRIAVTVDGYSVRFDSRGAF
jgi:hypothetical protein